MSASRSISIGHAVAETGDALVIIQLQKGCSRAAISASGARRVAAQLLSWAEHADAWRAADAETRKQDWIRMWGNLIQTQEWVVVTRADNTADVHKVEPEGTP